MLDIQKDFTQGESVGKSVYKFHHGKNEHILWDGKGLWYGVPYNEEDGVVVSYLIYRRAPHEAPNLLGDETSRAYFEGSYFSAEVIPYMLLFGHFCFEKGMEHASKTLSSMIKGGALIKSI